MSASSDDSLDAEIGLDHSDSDKQLLQSSMDEEKLNLRQLLPLCFQQFCETWNSDSIYAYVSFLVVDFGNGISADEAGLYAGFVAAAFFVGNFLTSYLWGALSDRFGRKRLLLFGGAGTLASIVMMGFSRSIWWAVVARCLCGMLNGNLGIAKSLIGEISTSKTIAPSFGLLGIAWGLGSICGSLAGGVLARPAVKMPSVFGGTIFETFPYLLTNLSAAAMMLVGLVTTAVFLQEPRRVGYEEQSVAVVGGRNRNNILKLIWQEKMILLSIALYVLCGAVNTFCKESNPLFFVASPDRGGLDFDTTETGVMIGVTGLTTILFQLLAYKRLTAYLGLVRSFRVGMVFFASLVTVVPVARFFLFARGLMWTYLIVIFALQTCASQMLFSSVFALISNSAEKRTMGRVNGVSQSLVAFFRALGPPVAGRLLAWSIADPTRIFPNMFVNYMVQFFFFAGIFGVSLLLRNSLNRPQDEQVVEVEMSVSSSSSGTDEENDL